MKKILVPIDFSAVTGQVCKVASDLAAKLKARLVFLHVVQPPPVIVGDYGTAAAGQLADMLVESEKTSAKNLESLARRYAKRAGDVRTIQGLGQPVAVILDHAGKINPDYVVIGTHGHGAVYDLLMGSTTHGVLRGVSCPVLVVPMKPASPRRPKRK